jgi:hypothetical protein
LAVLKLGFIAKSGVVRNQGEVRRYWNFHGFGMLTIAAPANVLFGENGSIASSAKFYRYNRKLRLDGCFHGLALLACERTY